ncbi:hypothetical protein SNE35_19355 [Paucibacter sp. R3-3]|uniref:Uncharacterized protein n=1 Tax=Roseateles agri TaxID=3098619 RepID=A0ABU5DKM0_9BURK|nr:hypothetical protein [Paucibacter sp. R3-3]MDY0746679.1 hypothetical protein [Paucibacter sp. R3-3]
MNSSPAIASRAKRAIGAMFFTVFGGAWIALWARFTLDAPLAAYALVALLTGGLLTYVYRVYTFNRPALLAEPASPADARRSRLFHLVNAGQWVLIVIVSNVLVNLGHPEWAIPAAMFVIGAHFIPLARLFSYAPHFVTAAALTVVALLSPALQAWSGAGPIGDLIAGLILWVSALYAVAWSRT